MRRANRKANAPKVFPEVEKLRQKQKKELAASSISQKELIRKLIEENQIDLSGS
jgi:hypothetical protein